MTLTRRAWVLLIVVYLAIGVAYSLHFLNDTAGGRSSAVSDDASVGMAFVIFTALWPVLLIADLFALLGSVIR